MKRHTLYLFVGYPGAGKTRVSRIIAETNGAVHLWADTERHKMFPNPTHSLEESQQLYDHLNAVTEDLLAQGKSVVFDTNFNFHADREKLRAIAERQGAEMIILWIATPVEVAKKRAVGTRLLRNGYTMSMSEEQFDAIAAKLEPPTKDENFIKIDGTEIDREKIIRLLR